MPLDATAVGRTLGTIDITYDDRWLMAFAAGVPDEHGSFYDTVAGVVAHPLFPVAPEWALLIAPRAEHGGLSPAEERSGLHIAHDLQISRPLRSGDRIRVSAEIVAVGRMTAGATQQTLFTAVDDHGDTVWRTLFTNLFLGVELDGDPRRAEIDWPFTPPNTTILDPPTSVTSFVRSIDAHVYSECARIWNPIHTDVAAARRVGLDTPILHGTATLARSVSLVADLAGIERSSIVGVAGRFRAPVALGSTITVRLLGHDDIHVWFDTLTASGAPAISDGVLRRG